MRLRSACDIASFSFSFVYLIWANEFGERMPMFGWHLADICMERLFFVHVMFFYLMTMEVAVYSYSFLLYMCFFFYTTLPWQIMHISSAKGLICLL
jgi:hypothetical protein